MTTLSTLHTYFGYTYLLQGVHVYHKTHAAPRDGYPPLKLVPLSGGVFQLMCANPKPKPKPKPKP